MKKEHSKLLKPFGRVFLHGSRSFYEEGDPYDLSESDWDYATKDSEEKVGFLLNSEEWKEVFIEGYIDINTKRVFQTRDGEDIIQLSLREDLSKFEAIWSRVSKEFYWKNMWKKSPDFMGKEFVKKFLNLMYENHKLLSQDVLK